MLKKYQLIIYKTFFVRKVDMYNIYVGRNNYFLHWYFNEKSWFVYEWNDWKKTQMKFFSHDFVYMAARENKKII